MFSYTVRCKFSSPNRKNLSEQWLEWLRDEHIEDVKDGGATDATIFQMDSTDKELIFEIRYEFSNRAMFEKYEAEHASRLREEGKLKFPYELGLSYERTTGVSL